MGARMDNSNDQLSEAVPNAATSGPAVNRNLMNAETRIKLTIGDLTIALHAAHARIEELEAKLASNLEPSK